MENGSGSFRTAIVLILVEDTAKILLTSQSLQYSIQSELECKAIISHRLPTYSCDLDIPFFRNLHYFVTV